MEYPTWKRELLSYVLKGSVFILVIVLLFSFASVSYRSATMISDGSCNIAVLPIEGIILPFDGLSELTDLVISPRAVRTFIDDAVAESGINGILFEINSPGGTPVAAEWIMESIKNAGLPTVALVGDVAASGGYLVASAADSIVASPMSELGSIGVTMSYLEESQKNEEEGLTFVELARGKFKDAGNPNKPLTDEERELFEAQLEIVHEEFINLVANNRILDTEAVRNLADGSTLLGRAAREVGLVDHVGGRSEARRVFAEILETNVDDVQFCEYSSLLW